MEENPVPPSNKSSGIPKPRQPRQPRPPRPPKSTTTLPPPPPPVNRVRVVGIQGNSESERKRLKLQDPRPPPVPHSELLMMMRNAMNSYVNNNNNNNNNNASSTGGGGEWRCKSGSTWEYPMSYLPNENGFYPFYNHEFYNNNILKENEKIKKWRMEIAKNKEYVRNIGKIGPPSGLLSGLNPGILRHGIRNKKDVHSTIRSFIQTPPPVVVVHDHHDHVSLLSHKAANVASQWLDLFHQDLKGRLVAVEESKKRIRGVIENELGLLFSKNDRAHGVYWTAGFIRLEKFISDEEQLMTAMLKQIEYYMQFQCDSQGLNSSSELEKELMIRATAASLYSTCNILPSSKLDTTARKH